MQPGGSLGDVADLDVDREVFSLWNVRGRLECDPPRVGERGSESYRKVDRHEPPRVVDGAVDERRRDHARVGHEDPSPLVRGQRRVAQRDVVDEPRMAVDGYAVAELDRLRERQENARAEIAQRRGEREAGDDREDGCRAEKRASDLLRRRKDREHAPDADDRDERDDHPQEEAVRRAATRCDRRVRLGKAALVAIEAEVEQRSETSTTRSQMPP